jgi:type VI secretion system protein ImpL
LNEILFGADGTTTKFLKGPAQPFIGRSLSKGYYARQVQGLSIPFDPGFLSFLSRGAQSARPVRANYSITIEGLPTDANADARIQPQATRLELQCADQTQLLINRNYPIRKTFNWSPQNCGDVVFQIEVGSLVLSRRYTGALAFAKFLQDFSSGTHKFNPNDFPDMAGALNRLGIKYINVRYELSNHQGAIATLRAAPGRVPLNIAKCWEK